MKTVVLIVSNSFPKNHPKAGQPTNFIDAIHEYQKLHTIRLNYDYWSKQIQKVVNGDAVLSIRSWRGKPYASKQRTHLTLYPEDGVGIEKLLFHENMPWYIDFYSPKFRAHEINEKPFLESDIAKNDGLSLKDFQSWFTPKPKEPCAIIHFTNFRYT